MSSFEEIKDLFINEIKNNFHYQVALKIKDLIINDILTPNINFNFRYDLISSDYLDLNNKDREEQLILMSLKIVLGFDVIINNGCIIIDMTKFLN